MNRSSAREVRNPLLALPEVKDLQALDPATKAVLRRLLSAIAVNARERAENCWTKRKGPMAAYWQTVSVLAKHTRAALR